MISESEFNYLYRLILKEENKEVNKIDEDKIRVELNRKGLIDNDKPTDKAIKLFNNNYKVDNAIIMAAGNSSRFVPLCFEKPKGLIKVKNEILIERQIEQLLASNISDISIVTGCFASQFEYLKEKYPTIKIVYNDDYTRYNNISTLLRVIDELKNTYICSSDNYFKENVFTLYNYRAYYSVQYAKGETDEYCVSFDEDNLIREVKVGGKDSYYLIGHAYFNKEFSKTFKELINKVKDDQYIMKNWYWDDLYINTRVILNLYAKVYKQGVLLEFDNLEELQAFDDSYLKDPSYSKILKKLCIENNCLLSDISEYKNNKTKLDSFTCKIKGKLVNIQVN